VKYIGIDPGVNGGIAWTGADRAAAEAIAETDPNARPTPLSDALPKCGCGRTLATNDEAEAGVCSECAPPRPVDEGPRPEHAWSI
jgi:hypothetical protein